MLGLFILSWVVAPCLMLVASLGCGLLVRRLAGDTLGGVFVLPVGFAGLLVVSAFFTQSGSTAGLTGYALAALAVVGLVLERRTLAGMRPTGALVWPAAAAFVGFAVVAAPLVLTGSPGFTGYGRIVDIGHQFDFTAYLATDGRSAVGTADSSYLEVVRKLLGAGYPGGWQSALGGFAHLMGTDLMWLYQPFLAFTGGMGAVGLYCLLARAIAAQPLRAVAGAVSIQPNVLYAYGTAGGFKELSAAALLALSAALAPELAPGRRRWRELLPLAVALAAAIAAFNLAIGPWLGVLLAGFAAVTLWRRTGRLRVATGWVAIGVLTLALSTPALIEASRLAHVAAQAEGGTPGGRTAIADLGNLAAPMPVRATAGVWLSADYRFPPTGSNTPTQILIVLVLVLAAVGVVASIRRRDSRPVILLAASLVALLYFTQRTGPWLQLKAIAVGGPAILACAFAGAAGLAAASRSHAVAIGGWLAGAAVTVGVLIGNGLAYHNASIAPAERLRDLERIGTRYSGQGQAFYPYFEELAEYLLRRERGIGLVDPAQGRAVQPTPEGSARKPGMRFAWDLDELQLNYVQSFSLLILRRGPDQSRPPANWELAERTRFHEVWRKARPARNVLAHQPRFGKSPSRATCRRFAAGVRRASRRAPVRIVYAPAPRSPTFRLGRASHPAGWPSDGADAVLTAGPGEVKGRLRAGQTGTYEAWIQGSFGRQVTFSVDGKRVGAIENRQNYPQQYEHVGRLLLAAGNHRILIARGGGGLEPGNAAGDEHPIGPLVMVKVTAGAGTVRTAPAGEALDRCLRDDLDWIEIVRQ